MSTQPWERQDGESDKAWRTFVAYRDSPKRSLRQTSEDVGSALSVVGRWSRENAWQERVRAYDDHLAAAGAEAALTAAEESGALREENAQLGLLAVRARLRAVAEGEAVNARDLKDLILASSEAAKNSLLVTGGVTERTESRTEFADLSTNDVFADPVPRKHFDSLARTRAGSGTNTARKGTA